jgi:hypothetical protein
VPLSARNFLSREYHHHLCGKFWILAGLGISSKAQIPSGIYIKIIYVLRAFKKALTCPNRIINALVMEGKVYISRRESKSWPRSCSLRLRIQNFRPYRDVCIPTERHAKFQLSRCDSGRKIGDRQRDRHIDISRFFF